MANIKYSIEQALYKNLIFRTYYSFNRKTIWNYIDKLSYNCNLSRKQATDNQEMLFRKQIEYCYNNIPFYKKRFDDAGFHISDNWSYAEFAEKVPVLEKYEIEDALARLIPESKGQGLVKRQTSGSTGTPLIVFKDNLAASFIDAAMHRNFLWYNIKIGDRRAHFWGGGGSRKQYLRYIFRDFLTNWRRFNCFELSKSSVLKFHSILERFRPKYLYGYAKCIYEYVCYAQELGLSLCHIPSVVVITGEKIYADQKNIIRSFFHAPVAEEYGCTECGIIAFECPQGGMHIMSDMLFVETVREQLPTKPGVAGSVVLTELRGNFFPLIRYRIGDTAILTESSCTCNLPFPLIEEIQGREDDYIICPDGSKIDAYCIEYCIQQIPDKLGKVSNVKGTQTLQSEIDIMVAGEFVDWAAWKKDFLEKIKNYLPGIKVNLQLMDGISRNLSGKMQFFESTLGDKYDF
ncbi:MAG TPA: phenylacetate--CoA ligase family protein [Gammaproteobacteria bacterium]|nr:phenylacetate--CoA ligase family protein [Gammaproteobacteria bacterium]